MDACVCLVQYSHSVLSQTLMTVSFPSVLHLVGGDKCPMAIENSCDLFDSTLMVPPRSGTKLKLGNSGRVGFGSRTF